MAWLAALIKAILEWLAGEAKKDTKAGDADAISQPLKDRWRDRVNEQLEKEKLDYYKFQHPVCGGKRGGALRAKEELKARGLGYKPNEKGEWIKHETS